MWELLRENVYKTVSTKEEVDYFLSQGFKVVSQPKTEKEEVALEKVQPTPNKKKVNYKAMSTVELRNVAKGLKITGVSNLTKSHLIELLESLE